MDLFIDYGKKLESTLEKLSEPMFDLGENPATWPNAILAKFLQKAPFASNYAVTVDLVEVDPENAAGFGQVVIKTKSFRPSSSSFNPQKLKAQEINKKIARVPVIVRQGQLYPMDILLHNGKMTVLNEDNLEQAMFRPNIGYGLDEPSGGNPLGLGSNAPSRGITGMGATTPISKTSAVATPITDAILPTIKEFMTAPWAEKLASNEDLKEFALQNPSVATVLTKGANVKSTSIPREAYYAAVPETVAQFYFDDGAYHRKYACRTAYHPIVESMGRREALDMFGEDLVKTADAGQATTITTEEAPSPEAIIEPEEVKKPGVYRVRQVDNGKDLVGYVFTDVRNIDGSSKGIVIFTNGSVAAIQNSIVGNYVGASNEVPDDTVSGQGVFYQVGPQGVVTAFGPFTVQGEASMEGDKSWLAHTEAGVEVNLHPTPEVKQAVPIEEGHFAIPASWRWASIGDKLVAVAESEGAAQKLSYDASVYRNVEVLYGGQNYSFRGPIVEKIAHVDRQDLCPRDAEFLAATLGYTPQRFAKVAHDARSNGIAVMELCLPVKKAEDIMDNAVKTASAEYEALSPLCVDLLKEAAYIPDPTTVDAMLSLNFITPENVTVFIGYKRNLEEAVNQLGQLLMAARLGMERHLPIEALLKAMKSLDKVTKALNRLEAGEGSSA